jgi:uncharacterized protein (DUF2384 family)
VSEAIPEDGSSAPTQKRGSMRFRRRSDAAHLSPDSLKRQGAVSTLAFQLFGRERAIEFLNADHSHLGGRPLDLATASGEGMEKVEAELRRIAALTPGQG